MICKSCKKKINEIDVYCDACGEVAESFKKKFKLKEILSVAKKNVDIKRDYPLQAIIFIFIFSILPLLLTGFFIRDNVFLNSHRATYFLSNLIYLVFVPLIFLPFTFYKDSDEKADSASLFRIFKIYPRFMFFVFIVLVYFFILKIICQGDPILNLVRFVLVLWGLAIALPVPLMIIKTNDSVISIIKKAFIAGKYLRWQQFSLVLILGIYNMLALIPLGLGLIFSLPFTSSVLKEYHKRQEDYNLYERNKDY